MGYSIKEVSERTGLSAYGLRYYEKEGLLPHVDRTPGGIRAYSDEDLELLGLICCLKETGMPLKEIRTFVQLSEQGPATLAERCAILERRRQSVLASIEALNRTYEKVSHKQQHFQKKLEAYRAEQDQGDAEAGD